MESQRTRSEPVTLLDVGTGVTTTREGQVTISIDAHPLYRELYLKSFLTVVLELEVSIEDTYGWEEALGAKAKVKYGTELQVDGASLLRALEGADDDDDLADMLVPLRVNDPYWPNCCVVAKLSALRQSCVIVPIGQGPRHGSTPIDCGHEAEEEGCPFCFYRSWRKKWTWRKGGQANG